MASKQKPLNFDKLWLDKLAILSEVTRTPQEVKDKIYET